jgi:hypothetical protein
MLQGKTFPLPRIDNTMDMVSGATSFSIMDLISSYRQVAPHHDDMKQMAFSIGQRLCQFTVTTFGLCNSPSTFIG